MLVVSIIATVWAALIAAHAYMIRRHRVAGAYEPAPAVWLASLFGPLPAPAGSLAHLESRAFDRLLIGDLEPAEYRQLMAALAAEEALRRPLRVP